MTEPVFIVAAAMACGTVLVIVKTIANAFANNNDSADELSQLRTHADQVYAALEETQSTVALQSTQIAELQERLDFAERLLTQTRERDALGPGETA